MSFFFFSLSPLQTWHRAANRSNITLTFLAAVALPPQGLNVASICLLSLHIKALLDVTPPSLSDLHLIKCSLFFFFSSTWPQWAFEDIQGNSSCKRNNLRRFISGRKKNGVTKHRWSGYRPANQDEGVRGGFVRFKALALDFECTLSQNTSTFD